MGGDLQPSFCIVRVTLAQDWLLKLTRNKAKGHLLEEVRWCSRAGLKEEAGHRSDGGEKGV